MDWQTLLCDDRIRSYKKQSSTDLRTEFEKDYHRIIGSASFRRLQDKTQVFPLDRSDFIRTRLTHSLEVSSLAKSLAAMAAIGLMPAAMSHGIGSESQRPLAIVIIGGLIGATFFALFVFPLIVEMVYERMLYDKNGKLLQRRI